MVAQRIMIQQSPNDSNWMITILAAAITAVGGFLTARLASRNVAKTQQDAATDTAFDNLSRLVGNLSTLNQAQRAELDRYRVENTAFQQSAVEAQRQIAFELLDIKGELANTKTMVQRQSAVFHALNETAWQMFPQQWSAILKAVRPEHNDIILMYFPPPAEPPIDLIAESPSDPTS